MAQKKKEWPEGLTDGNVIAYLMAHRDFLVRFPELLEHMKSPGKTVGEGVADFQQFMLERLKQDKVRALETQRALIETTRENLNNQSRVNLAVLGLLDAKSFEELIETVTQDLAILLDVDVVALVVESNGQDVPEVLQSGVRIVPPGAIDRYLGEDDEMLQSGIEGKEEIFGPGAGLVKSQALLRLYVSSVTPQGLIAFGSRNPDLFGPDQATDQISFLAQVIERCIRMWLDLPV